MYKNKICLVYYVLGCKSKTYNGCKGSIFFQTYKTIKDKITIMSKKQKNQKFINHPALCTNYRSI